MSDLKVDGFKSSEFISLLGSQFVSFSEKEKNEQIKKVKGIFDIILTNAEGKTETWSIDLKNKGQVLKGPSPAKADITLTMSDETFSQLASGKTSGQTAFMTGKLKAKGNIMLATKLDAVLKTVRAKL